MKIMSENEFERRLEQAKQEGYRQAEREIAERREFEEFRRSIWNDVDRIKQDTDVRLCRLEDRIGTEEKCRKANTGDIPQVSPY